MFARLREHAEGEHRDIAGRMGDELRPEMPDGTGLFLRSDTDLQRFAEFAEIELGAAAAP